MEDKNIPYNSQEIIDRDPVSIYATKSIDSRTQELKEKFTPILSGGFNRNLVRENIRPDNSSAMSQSLGVKKLGNPSNANNEVFQKTVEFPQPAVVGMGSILTTGAKATTRPFYSQSWTVARTGVGTYEVSHAIGDTYYIVLLTINTAGLYGAVVTVGATSFIIETYDATGTATDADTTFMVYKMI